MAENVAHDISIDPGTNSTGVCVWRQGEVVDFITIRPPTELEFVEKLWHIKQRLIGVCEKYEPVGRIAVEEWERFYQRPNMGAMMKCSAIRGAILCLADDWARRVVSVSKKQVSKRDTAILSKAKGLKGASKDALDAFQIGVTAGFDRVRG